jgi:glycosyltransferase involved in cell wall biosynthesis
MTENFNPLVSVVIPTYNHAAFLNKALQSVVDQTYKNLEILVVNNFSTDDTEAIVSSFSDKNISLFNFRNNGIIAAARNHGIQHATGEFIAFLDSDDVWYPTKIEECIHALKSGADIACHGEFWVMPNGHRREVMYGPEKNATYKKLLHRGNCISTSTVVVQKSILQEINGFSEREDFVTTEDYDCWMRIAQATDKFVFVRKVLGEYLLHEGNASNSIMRNHYAELAVVASHFEHQAPTPLRMLRWRQRIARAQYAAARGLHKNGSFKASIGMYSKSVLTSPFVLRTYAGILLLTIAKIQAKLKRTPQ